MSLLTLHTISKRYGAVTVLDGIDLTLQAGSRTAIVGPSGSGKTSLLRLIAGFETPDSGTIRLDGQILADAKVAVPAHLRNIGVVPQDGALFPHLTIAENIGFGLPRQSADRTARIAALMRMVGLDPILLPRNPDQLSGGQQQRVALARALARKPRLMLLDEPFSALDTGLRAATRKAVADLLAAEGVTTILVTHDQAEALSFAEQVGVMRAGRLLQIGPPRDLYQRPKDPMIAEFLGDALLLPAEAADGWAVCALGRVRLSGTPRGPIQIMLRPEQITLTDAEAGAQIIAVDFGGSACVVTVRLTDGTPVTLRTPSITTPAVGARVGLSVLGVAHFFPPTA